MEPCLKGGKPIVVHCGYFLDRTQKKGGELKDIFINIYVYVIQLKLFLHLCYVYIIHQIISNSNTAVTTH